MAPPINAPMDISLVVVSVSIDRMIFLMRLVVNVPGSVNSVRIDIAGGAIGE